MGQRLQVQVASDLKVSSGRNDGVDKAGEKKNIWTKGMKAQGGRVKAEYKRICRSDRKNMKRVSRKRKDR